MRAIKTTITSILALGLLAGSAVGVTAQEADPMAPSTFTIQRPSEPDVTEDPDTGAIIVVGPVESTDARASGTQTIVVGGAQFDVPDGDGGRISLDAVQIVNDDGRWVGTNRGFVTFPSDGRETVQFLSELVGEGNYEGLSMFLAETGDHVDLRWLGMIVPTAEVPAIPDLPATE